MHAKKYRNVLHAVSSSLKRKDCGCYKCCLYSQHWHVKWRKAASTHMSWDTSCLSGVYLIFFLKKLLCWFPIDGHIPNQVYCILTREENRLTQQDQIPIFVCLNMMTRDLLDAIKYKLAVFFASDYVTLKCLVLFLFHCACFKQASLCLNFSSSFLNSHQPCKLVLYRVSFSE